MPRRSLSQPHLERRPTGYYWRRRWPAIAVARAHRQPSPASICVSLRTESAGEARGLAQRLSGVSDRVFAAVAARVDPLALAPAQAFLQGLVAFRIEAAVLVRELDPAQRQAAIAFELDQECAEREVLRRALVDRDADALLNPLDALAEALCMAPNAATLTAPDVVLLALRARLAAAPAADERVRPVLATRLDMVAGASSERTVPSTSPLPESHRRTASETSMIARPLSDGSTAPRHSDNPPAAPASTRESMPESKVESKPRRGAAPPLPQRFRDPAFGNGLDHAWERITKALPATRAPEDVAEMTVSDAFALYAMTRCTGRKGRRATEVSNVRKGASWAANSLSNVLATGRLMVSILGDARLGDLAQAHFVEAFNLIQRLPVLHGRSSRETRDVRALVDETDRREQAAKARAERDLRRQGGSEGRIEAAVFQESIPRLRAATIYRQMEETQQVLRFMMALGALAGNLMETVIWTTDERDEIDALQEDAGRKTWGDRLPLLLRTPAFQDALEDPGDPMFWAPLIAIHAGLRMEEALQLRCDDIGREAGVTFFDIRLGPDQSLKTRAATRRVPLHRNLIALGLAELVALRRRQGEDRLFPHLRRGRDRGSLSSLFTKEFTRYRQAHDVYDRARDFHSFRTGFNVELINQGVHAEIRKILMGHVIRDVNLLNYGGDGHPLVQLRRAVDLIEVDVTMVRRPFGPAARADVLTLADHRSGAGAA